MTDVEIQAETDEGEPVTTDADAATEARDRAAACGAELSAILEKYRCVIVPRMETEPVGVYGSKMMIDCTRYGVIPQPKE